LGGWYGTASIEAMAIGRPVVVSIREEYFQYIDCKNKVPAILADPDIIYNVLRETLEKGIHHLINKGRESRKFVEEVHDVRKITEKLVDIYEKL
jgi:lipid A disaccharide synthetase